MKKSNEQKFVEDFMNFVFAAEPQLSLTDAKFIDYVHNNLDLINNIELTNENKAQVEKHVEQEFFSVIAKKQKVVFSNSGYIITFKESFDKIISPFDSSKVKSKNKEFVKSFVGFICEKLMSLSSQYQAFCSAITQNVVVESMEIQKLYEDVDKCEKKLSSLVNDLNISRKEDYQKLKTDIDDAQANIDNIKANEVETLEKRISSAESQVKNAVMSTNNLIPNMLTSLGIFVTIIVTIVAVYVSNAFPSSRLEFAIPQMRFARYVLSGQITFNCIFFLLYFISKLTGRTIHLSRISNDKQNALMQMGSIRASMFYNPALWFVNFVLLLAYFLLYDWWLIEMYIWPNLEILINIADGDFNILAASFASLSILVVTLIPIVTMTTFYAKSKKQLEQTIKSNP